MPRLHTYPEILATIREANGKDEWPKRLTVVLDEGDTAWHPTSTKQLIHGPCKVDYVEHQDGGWGFSTRDARLPVFDEIMGKVFK